MKALVFATSADAKAVAAQIDTQMGYPRPGVDVGGGVHVPPTASVTRRYADVMASGDKSQYAVLCDEKLAPVLAAVKGAVKSVAVPDPVEVAMDDTWTVGAAAAVAVKGDAP